MRFLFFLLLFSTLSCDLNKKPDFTATVKIIGKKIKLIESNGFLIESPDEETILNLNFGSFIYVHTDSVLTVRVFSISPKFKNHNNKSNIGGIYKTTID